MHYKFLSSKLFISSNFQMDMAADNPENLIIVLPFKHVKQRKMRTNNYMSGLWTSYNHWLKVPQELSLKLESISASLLVIVNLLDDIQDDAILRRRIPVAYLIYGIPLTVHSALYTLFIAVQKLLDFGVKQFEMLECLILGGLNVCLGQMLEGYYAKNCICPTEEEYLEVVYHKTVMSMTGAFSFLQTFSGFEGDVSKVFRFCHSIWQLCNDYADFKSEIHTSRKLYCEDITAGVFSYPVMHAIQSHPEEGRIIMEAMRKRITDYEEKRALVKLMEDLGSFRRLKQLILHNYENLLKEIKRLGGNKPLEMTVKYVVEKAGDGCYD